MASLLSASRRAAPAAASLLRAASTPAVAGALAELRCTALPSLSMAARQVSPAPSRSTPPAACLGDCRIRFAPAAVRDTPPRQPPPTASHRPKVASITFSTSVACSVVTIRALRGNYFRPTEEPFRRRCRAHTAWHFLVFLDGGAGPSRPRHRGSRPRSPVSTLYLCRLQSSL